MTCLLWVRTRLRISSYGDEVERFEEDLRHAIGREFDEPFLGGDHLLYAIDDFANIHQIRAMILPLMGGGIVDDWSLTEVGMGFGREVDVEQFDDGTFSWDDRFVHADDVVNDLRIEALAEWSEKNGVAPLLRWQLSHDAAGATCLWVDLANDLESESYLVQSIGRLAPTARRIWHGRSSLAFVFSSSHSLDAPSPYGLSAGLKAILDDERVDDWLIFAVGNRSVGGAGGENMNQMADFIWSRRRHAKSRSKPRRAAPEVKRLRDRSKGRSR